MKGLGGKEKDSRLEKPTGTQVQTLA